MTGEELPTYYARRAREYEQVYENPERQTDLVQVGAWLRDVLAGHRILEVAWTYQQRRLADGTVHEVLKNFPTPAELEAALAPVAQELSVVEFAYYWGVRYRVASAA